MNYLEKKLEGYTKKAAQLKETVLCEGFELDSDDIYKAISEIDACNFIVDTLKLAIKNPLEPMQAFAILTFAREVEEKYFNALNIVSNDFEEKGKMDKQMLGELTFLRLAYNELAKIVNGLVEEKEEVNL
ncbi:hypothetical protein KAMFAM_31 [Bacillus phage Kamfam]|nr:hypothetical protein OTK52_29 [Bacillus phage OTooleKemple52]AXQ67305.1 hypothetical protein KAMFAM_31 [Bacillus phage Kamfam]